jgi:hypothetical protein
MSQRPTDRRSARSRARLVAIAGGLAIAVACGRSGETGLPADGLLPLGTWGGDSAGMIVGDTATHLHVACTYGDVSGRIAVGTDGRFDVQGSYLLRAYPIAVGPTVPARFVGQVSGRTAVVTVTVNDTIGRRVVVRGPVIVRLGDPPVLGPCPICRRPVTTQRR